MIVGKSTPKKGRTKIKVRGRLKNKMIGLLGRRAGIERRRENMKKFVLIGCMAVFLFFSGCAPIPQVTKTLRFLESTPQKPKDFETTFMYHSKGVAFSLQNHSNKLIKIIWDEAALVDCSGKSHRVMHEGVKYISRDQLQPPTMLPPGANIRDVIVPTSLVSYTSGRYGGWYTNDLPTHNGCILGVNLSMEIGGRKENYYFKFVVEHQ